MLSTRTRYSIVALADIARARSAGGRAGGKPVPTALSKIADGRGLSLDYLEQLAVRWRRAGLVKGVRGPAGGYVLARAPEDITLADIAAAVGEIVSATCADETAETARRAGCPAQKISDFLTARIQADLAAISLADVMAGRLAPAVEAERSASALSQPTA